MGKGIGIALLVIAWIALLIVQAVFLIKRGQSLGKMAVGIRIVKVSDESAPGFVKVFLLRMFIPNLLYGIPYLGVALLLVDLLFIFREDRRCVHDLIAETKVVDTSPTLETNSVTLTSQRPASERVASVSPPPPPQSAVTYSPPLPVPPVTNRVEGFPPAVTSSALQQNFTVDEDAVYAAIANELKTGATDEGLWTRLFAESDGDENRTKVAYIKQRAEKLIALEQSRLAKIKRQFDEEAARLEAIRLESLSLREQLSAGYQSEEIREKLKLLSGSYTAVMFIGKVRNNLLHDVESLLKDNPLLVAVTNSDGNTPLHLSIMEKYVKMSQLLLEKGAPTYTENNDGDTPLNLARKTGKQSLVALISTFT